MPLFLPPAIRRFAILALLSQLGWAGCTNRKSAMPPPPPAPDSFSESGYAQRLDRWWVTFDDIALNAQVGRAFDGNFSLAAALERVIAAQALTRREASDLFPDLDGLIGTGADLQTNGPDNGDFTLGYALTYQVDLWGEIEARVQAQQFLATASFEDYQAIALTLAADVAGTWFSLIEAHAQLALLDEQIETNRTGLELQEARFGLGQVQSADVLRQRQLVEATIEQTVIVQSRIATLEHLLGVLQGIPPQAVEYEPGDELPSLPPLPAAGLPSDLLRRRPDVRRDFFALRAADRQFASAVSSQYPRLNLTGSLTTAATNSTDLFRDTFVSIGSQLIAPIFDGGQRRAEVARTAAVTRQRFNEYMQTSLVAFQQVEDALARERFLIERIERLDNQVKLAKESSERLREQYLLTEDTDFLAVLSATTDAQRLQRTTLSVRLDLILNRIQLYLALAGGIDVPNAGYETTASIPPLPTGADTTPMPEVDGSDEGRADAADGQPGGDLPLPAMPELPEAETPLPSMNDDRDPTGDTPEPADPDADGPEAVDDEVIRDTPLGIPSLEKSDSNLKDLSTDEPPGGSDDE